MELTHIERVLMFGRKWSFGKRSRLRKEIRKTLACKLCALCVIEAVYPTRDGWTKINASSFHSSPRILVLTWSISAYFSTLCTIRVDLSAAKKDLVMKQAASGQVYYQLDYDVIVLFGLTELQAQLGWKTKVSYEAIPRVIC